MSTIRQALGMCAVVSNHLNHCQVVVMYLPVTAVRGSTLVSLTAVFLFVYAVLVCGTKSGVALVVFVLEFGLIVRLVVGPGSAGMQCYDCNGFGSCCSLNDTSVSNMVKCGDAAAYTRAQSCSFGRQ